MLSALGTGINGSVLRGTELPSTFLPMDVLQASAGTYALEHTRRAMAKK